MSKKPEPFNNPFGKLKERSTQPEAAKRPLPVAAKPPPKRAKSTEEEDAALFLEAVGGVAPARAAPARAVPAAPRGAGEVKIVTDESEAMARLAELVSSGGAFEVADSDGLVEGAIRGFDERVMRRLRAGDFCVEAQLDLHGFTREEAQPALERFIQQARIAGRRCVVVVTGRGLHSADQVPVLRESVQEWLTRGRLAKQLLAFCRAQPKDGGAGAISVLLRR